MFPTKYLQQLLGSVLALVAFTLSACTSPAASTSRADSIATATVARASSPVGVASTDAGTVTPAASAYATGLLATATPIPQPTKATVPPTRPAPNVFQGQDCGHVEMLSKGLIDAPGNAPAIDCLWRAYQQCPTVEKAQLFIHQRFFETSNNRYFRLDGTSGSCVVSEELQAYGLMANTPQISMFTCTGLTRDSGGLHFLSCGSDGDFTIPATPIGSAQSSPAPASGTSVLPPATPPASPPVGKSATAPGIVFTVALVLDPASAVRFGTAPAGARFVAVNVMIANTDTTPHPYDVANLTLRATTGTAYQPARNVDTDVLMLDAGTTAPGATTLGWVVFAVPATVQLASVAYSPTGATPMVISVTP